MSDWRLAALGVLPPRHHQSLLQRLETGLARLAPHVGAPGAGGGSSRQALEQLLSSQLRAAGLDASQSDVEQLSAAISKGGAAGMAVAIVVTTWVADGETDDEVTVAFGSLAARPMVVLQQLWTPSGSPPLSNSALGTIARMPPNARAAAIIAALRPRKPPG
jgi:hypothetical protein